MARIDAATLVGVIVAHLDAATLAGVRLAPSPAVEAVSWLRLAARGGAHPVYGRACAAARFALRDPDVALVARTLPAHCGYMPDLLTPQPARGTAERIWGEQVERIATASAQTVADQIAKSVGKDSPDVRDAVQSGRFAARAARGLARFWDIALRENWSALRTRIDGDVAAKATTMATEGVGGVFDSLDPMVRWTGTAVVIDKPWEETLRFQERDFVLSPSALAYPSVLMQLCNGEDAVISYLARGAEPTAGGGVSRLVGSTRARLLRDLDVPRSTSDLSRRNALSPATVSYHLSVMHGSGLVTKTRERRTVLYRRTERGDALR